MYLISGQKMTFKFVKAPDEDIIASPHTHIKFHIKN